MSSSSNRPRSAYLANTSVFAISSNGPSSTSSSSLQPFSGYDSYSNTNEIRSETTSSSTIGVTGAGPSAGTTTTTTPTPPATTSKSTNNAPQIKRGKTGCITCRIRKKRCDEAKPTCNNCDRLGLDCMGYSVQRPAWLKAKEVENQLKLEIKQKSTERRRTKKTVQPKTTGISKTRSNKNSNLKVKSRTQNDSRNITPYTENSDLQYESTHNMDHSSAEEWEPFPGHGVEQDYNHEIELNSISGSSHSGYAQLPSALSLSTNVSANIIQPPAQNMEAPSHELRWQPLNPNEEIATSLYGSWTWNSDQTQTHNQNQGQDPYQIYHEPSTSYTDWAVAINPVTELCNPTTTSNPTNVEEVPANYHQPPTIQYHAAEPQHFPIPIQHPIQPPPHKLNSQAQIQAHLQIQGQGQRQDSQGNMPGQYSEDLTNPDTSLDELWLYLLNSNDPHHSHPIQNSNANLKKNHNNKRLESDNHDFRFRTNSFRSRSSSNSEPDTESKLQSRSKLQLQSESTTSTVITNPSPLTPKSLRTNPNSTQMYFNHYLDIILPLQFRFIEYSTLNFLAPLALNDGNVMNSLNCLAALHLSIHKNKNKSKKLENRGKDIDTDARINDRSQNRYSSINGNSRIENDNGRIREIHEDADQPLNLPRDGKDEKVAEKSFEKTMINLRLVKTSPKDTLKLTSTSTDKFDSNLVSSIFAISYIIFKGGISHQWVESLEISRKCLSAGLNNSPELGIYVTSNPSLPWNSEFSSNLPTPPHTSSRSTNHAESPWKRYRPFLHAMIRTDIIICITENKGSELLPIYRFLLNRSPYHTSNFDQPNNSMPNLSDLDNTTMLALAETCALSEWKMKSEKERCLDIEELVKRGSNIKNLLNERSWRERRIFNYEIELKNLVERMSINNNNNNSNGKNEKSKSNMNKKSKGYSSEITENDILKGKLLSDVFFQGSKILLAITMNGSYPKLQSIKEPINKIIELINQLSILENQMNIQSSQNINIDDRNTSPLPQHLESHLIIPERSTSISPSNNSYISLSPEYSISQKSDHNNQAIQYSNDASLQHNHNLHQQHQARQHQQHYSTYNQNSLQSTQHSYGISTQSYQQKQAQTQHYHRANHQNPAQTQSDINSNQTHHQHYLRGQETQALSQSQSNYQQRYQSETGNLSDHRYIPKSSNLVTNTRHTNEFVRSLVFPLTIAACHCTKELQPFFRKLFLNLNKDTLLFGNTKYSWILIEKIWEKRNNFSKKNGTSDVEEKNDGDNLNLYWLEIMKDKNGNGCNWEHGLLMI
ncbi:uncharacterized protein L201_006907 [Kwoniella dendrophila CBS 6074]|uniref:Zn(2)-C6 fungal-type domain-containing protein n=1 Tax=Kwoniella dendrophila CBS 6074 TaxID=1295534 RepID=A0AAX4K5A8_9TREE